MEYLSRALKLATTTPSFKYHPGCRKQELVHLMIADDLMLFCVADINSVQSLMRAFQAFSETTGLTANYSK